MKNIILLFHLFIFSQIINAQTAVDFMSINNVKGYILNNGSVFRNANLLPGFEAPKGSGKTTIFSSGIWIGALDSGNQMHVAGILYNQAGYDYSCGPSSTGDSTQACYYDKIYRITKNEVNYHLLHYKDNGYVTSANIANWPTHGRNIYNEPQRMALFNDKNNNNIYEPNMGESPLFPGDEATLCIYNDNRVHAETGGNPLNVEIYQFTYAYNNADSALANTIFVSYRIINRSKNNYKNLYLGQFVDYDIGDYADDEVGCDTLLNLMYGYNGRNIDVGIGGSGYGKNPPAMGCLFLNKAMSNCMYFNNDFSNTGNPTKPEDFYNYLQAKWIDGTQLTSDMPNGHGGNVPAHYMFSGDPVSSTGWTEKSAGNVPGDRKLLASVGPYNFDTSQEMCYLLAYVYARGDSGPLSSIKKLKSRAAILSQIYANNGIDDGCTPKALTGIVSNYIAQQSLEVFPNPAGEYITVKYNIDQISDLIIYDITGKIIYKNILKPLSETIVNTSSFAQGIYMIAVGNKNMKLLKQ